MQRASRLIRSLQTIALSCLKILYAPSAAREFFAHVYVFRPFGYTDRIANVSLPTVLSEVAQMPVTLR